jgi:hypothetical protein
VRDGVLLVRARTAYKASRRHGARRWSARRPPVVGAARRRVSLDVAANPPGGHAAGAPRATLR